MTEFTRESLIAEAEQAASRPDPVHIAEALRGGSGAVSLHPVLNGWFVQVGNDSLVITKAEDIGRLLHTLYTANLDNVDAIKRLHRLMGY